MKCMGWISVVLLCATAYAATASMGKGAMSGKLPVQDSISQYGITWTFDNKVPVGQFVTGDYYVVGPVTVASVTPAPAGSGESFRNGSMLNPPTTRYSAYDGRFRNTFRQELAAAFPVQMKPGDSLVSAISLEQLQQNQVFPNNTRSNETSPLRTAAVLTCLGAPVPADAFRPSYCDLKKEKIHRASQIRWDLLPSVEPTKSAPSPAEMERVFERPWLDHVYDWSSRSVHASENLPGYGREIGRVVSIAALVLCCDFTQKEKEKLAIGLVQVGIDNWGVAKRGKAGEAGGWPAAGGFGNGRKWPIIFAGIMLQDEEMLNIKKYAPETCFGEDQHTAFGKSWTGANVLFTGQYPLIGHRQIDRGPYEHLHPSEWPGARPTMSEGYRRCCTSVCWIGQCLAARMMHAEGIWDHDAFFAYCDRWMTEDDSEAIKIIKEATGQDFSAAHSRQRQTWDPFVNEMWAAYRPSIDSGSE